MLRDTESYSLNGDAHRVRTTNVKPPAMTWHMAFWIPQLANENIDTSNVFENFRNREAIKIRLDSILIQITKSLRSRLGEECVTLEPSRGDVTVLLNDYYKTHDLSVLSNAEISRGYKDLENIIKPIRESDHRVIKIEFPWLDYWMTIRCSLQTEYFTIIVIAEVSKDLKLLVDEVGAINFFARAFNYQQAEESKYNRKECHLSILFNRFWIEFNRFIRSLDGVDLLMSIDLFEQIYADARGLVISDPSPRKDELHSNIIESQCEAIATQWARQSIKRYREELTVKDRYECTASFVLDQRAIFMTALGPQNPNREPGSRNPLTFLIILRKDLPSGDVPIDKWQLGRLIDRIHFAGRTRLAALRNVKILRLVSAELARIDQLIANARKDIEDYGSKNDTSSISVINIEKLRTRLNSISEGFLLLSDQSSKSSISYRVERSRYYVRQFRNSVPQLRLSRIEGYQKYDDFIEKRLGGTFDSIDGIGVRYERALRAMASIDQNYLAAQSHSLAAQSHRTNESIEEIQKWGELFLISVLVPYYIFSLVKGFIDYIGHFGIFAFSWVFVILAIFSLYGLKKFSSLEKSRKGKWKVRGLGCLILVIVLAISILQAEIKDVVH